MRRRTKKNIKRRLYKKGGGNIVKYYLIHGPDEHRKKLMNEQIINGGIDPNDVTWIEGYNKGDLSQELINIVSTNNGLKPGEISCALKHYLALRKIVENKDNLAVIMEDDIIFKDNVPNCINKYLEQLPDDWGILFESDYLKYTEGTVYQDKLVYKKNNENGGSRCANFYLIKYDTAVKLYNSFLPFNKAVDHYYNDLFINYNINSYWSEPSNVSVRKDVASIINN